MANDWYRSYPTQPPPPYNAQAYTPAAPPPRPNEPQNNRGCNCGCDFNLRCNCNPARVHQQPRYYVHRARARPSHAHEQTPLIPAQAKNRSNFGSGTSSLLIISIALVLLAGIFSALVIITNEDGLPSEPERDAIRREWEREKAAREWERIQWAEEKKEHDKGKNQLYWADLQGGHCLAYNTREYTARLWNVPTQYDWVYDACMDKNITIGGKMFEHPTHCKEEGTYASWTLSDDEPECKTYWNTYRDKGCVGSHKRRHEARLNNHRAEDDWVAMCATTPRDINGVVYNGAHYCSPGGDGVRFGYWDVWDDRCG